MVRVLAAILLAASASASHDDGLSLLQKRATVLLNDDLPEPKKKATKVPAGQVEMVTAPTDFECKGGKGKWVFMNTPQDIGESTDVTMSTMDIKSSGCQPSPSARNGQRCEKYRIDFNAPPGNPDREESSTEHGMVTSEKDCFARARIDGMCNHYTDNLRNYESVPPAIGVWYAPTNGFQLIGGGQCSCGRVRENNQSPQANTDYKVRVNDLSAPGAWFCQLLAADTEDVDQNTPKDLAAKPPKEPKEKKEKKSEDDKEECAAAKAAAKDSKAALKALRKELKDARAAVKALKAELKEAKADWLEKKGVRKGAC